MKNVVAQVREQKKGRFQIALESASIIYGR